MNMFSKWPVGLQFILILVVLGMVFFTTIALTTNIWQSFAGECGSCPVCPEVTTDDWKN
jgi:hypothetical protein